MRKFPVFRPASRKPKRREGSPDFTPRILPRLRFGSSCSDQEHLAACGSQGGQKSNRGNLVRAPARIRGPNHREGSPIFSSSDPTPPRTGSSCSDQQHLACTLRKKQMIESQDSRPAPRLRFHRQGSPDFTARISPRLRFGSSCADQQHPARS